MKKSQKTGKRKKDTVRRDEAPGTPSGSVEDKPLPFRTLLPLVLIVLVGIYSYWNSFHAPFVFDDQTSITENPIIKNLGNFLSSLQGYHYNPRRFIGYLSFALNYHWGGLDVAGYHVVNFCIHLLNGTLVFLLCGLTFRTPFLRNSSQASKAGGIALVAALLFTAHPVQTQAVTYIVQRFTSLASLFYLLSLIFYVQGRIRISRRGMRDERQDSPVPSPQTPVPNFLFFIASFLTALLAMKTKEIAFTLPIVVLLYEVSFFGLIPRKKLIAFVPVLLTLLVVPLSLIGTHRPLGELLADVDRLTRDTVNISRGDYLLTQFRVVATYIRLLFFPVNQNLDYGFPVSHTFFSLPVIFSALFLATLLALALFLYKKGGVQGSRFNVQGPGPKASNSKFKIQNSKFNTQGSPPEPQAVAAIPELRLIAFGILWFFITLSVESSVIPIRDVIFEHRLYLPSVGAFLALATAAGILSGKVPAKAFWATVGVIVLVLGTASWQRNSVWQSEVALWRDAAMKSPNKPRPHYNLSKALMLKGDVDAALSEARTGVRLAPQNPEALTDLGAVYDRKGWNEKAIEVFRAALARKPDYVIARANLGIDLEKQGKVKEAIEEYRTALKTEPDDFTALFNLGAAYFREGKVGDAIREFELAVKAAPEKAEARLNLAVAYDRTGRLDEAIREYLAAEHLDPENVQVQNNLGVIYQKKGFFEKAAEQYLSALRLAPGNAQSHVNLATAYLQMGNTALAVEQFRKAVELDPQNAEYQSYLAQSLRLRAQRP